jgi:outer membrane biogenesis lipoprotein LolB
MTGCCSPFEDNSKDILIAYTVRQNAINEQRVREQEKKDAVKQIQLQAIRGGFAYWDVDENGDVTFKWVGQRKK